MTAQMFQQGFSGLEHEISCDQLEIEGCVPDWLAGTLVRNGPAKFDLQSGPVEHWFDGFAMLHAFTFKHGEVSYANRFLRGRTFRQAMTEGKLNFSAFAADPCRSLFGRVFCVLFNKFDNANVSVARIADRFVALTETPMAVEFDPQTLDTLGPFYYDRPVPGNLTTAHPLYDASRDTLINYTLRFNLLSSYHIYLTRGRRLTTIGPIRTIEPAYMHSFNMTERYIILSVFPFLAQPVELITNRDKPFIGGFRWCPERPTKFLVVDKDQREPMRIYEAAPTFGFHHINAFETPDGIELDLITYPDPSVIDLLYLEHVRDGFRLPPAEVRRYRLPRRGSTASFERISPVGIELPQFNEQDKRGQPYRYTYGVSAGKGIDFMKELVKVDVERREAMIWNEEDCYPGEPIFVPSPGNHGEDGGVVLSVVLDARVGRSFLLILDATTFDEIGRARVPHHIPFGFHGNFFADAA